MPNPDRLHLWPNERVRLCTACLNSLKLMREGRPSPLVLHFIPARVSKDAFAAGLVHCAGHGLRRCHRRPVWIEGHWGGERADRAIMGDLPSSSLHYDGSSTMEGRQGPLDTEEDSEAASSPGVQGQGHD